jgi:ABC-type transport system involved in cytochrome c biogenesis ATPase subunit
MNTGRAMSTGIFANFSLKFNYYLSRAIMKLIGVRVENFACFDSRTIEVKDGIALLVGKNNAGKTALLRAIQIIKFLPLGSFIGLPDNITQYFRPQKAFRIGLTFRLENDKELPISGLNKSDKESLIQDGVYEEVEFEWIAEVRHLSFRGAKFKIAGIKDLEAIQVSHTGEVASNHFQAIGSPLKEQPQVAGSSGHIAAITQSGNTRAVSFPENHHQLSSLRELARGVTYLSSYRQPARTMPLQTAEALPEDGSNLPAVLHTLLSNAPEKFEQVDRFVRDNFPSLLRVQVPTRDNQVRIALRTSHVNDLVSLAASGSGTEQLLAIVVFILQVKPQDILLLDEPHAFLHPDAERALVRFIEQVRTGPTLVSTHSPVLMNAVDPSRIVYVDGATNQLHDQEPSSIGEVFLALGYRQSDFLLHERILIVEGLSDVRILEVLFRKRDDFAKKLDLTLFSCLNGTSSTAKSLINQVIAFEKLLHAFSDRIRGMFMSSMAIRQILIFRIYTGFG